MLWTKPCEKALIPASSSPPHPHPPSSAPPHSRAPATGERAPIPLRQTQGGLEDTGTAASENFLLLPFFFFWLLKKVVFFKWKVGRKEGKRKKLEMEEKREIPFISLCLLQNKMKIARMSQVALIYLGTFRGGNQQYHVDNQASLH